MSAARAGPPDPRVQRTRGALLMGFNRLFLELGYESITPAAIAAAAGVGRSTFYEHFAGKAALLRYSVTAVLTPVAQAAIGQAAPSLPAIVQHFWDNRRFARRLLQGRPGIIIRERLAELIADALREQGSKSSIPSTLLATSVAAAQLALIEGFTSGHHRLSPGQLTQALVATSMLTQCAQK